MCWDWVNVYGRIVVRFDKLFLKLRKGYIFDIIGGVLFAMSSLITVQTDAIWKRKDKPIVFVLDNRSWKPQQDSWYFQGHWYMHELLSKSKVSILNWWSYLNLMYGKSMFCSHSLMLSKYCGFPLLIVDLYEVGSSTIHWSHCTAFGLM